MPRYLTAEQQLERQKVEWEKGRHKQASPGYYGKQQCANCPHVADDHHYKRGAWGKPAVTKCIWFNENGPGICPCEEWCPEPDS